MTERKVKVTFSETDKRIDLEQIAMAVANRLGKGGEKNVKRKKIS